MMALSIDACRGKMILDGEAMPDTLMDIVKAPWKANPSNSVVGFNDNSSAIRRGLFALLSSCNMVNAVMNEPDGTQLASCSMLSLADMKFIEPKWL